MVKATGSEPSIPRAESPTPYIPAVAKAKAIVAVKHTIGIIVDMYPRASPYMMFGAGPISQASVSLRVGL